MDLQTRTNNYEIHVAPYKRWGSGRRHDAQDAREHLINSAVECYRSLGVAKTTVIDVAAQARVTRQTVYRYFNGHHELLCSVIQRDLDFFWLTALEKLNHRESLCDFLVDLLVIALETSSRNLDNLIAFMPEARSALTQMLLSQNEILLEKLHDRFTEQGEFSLALLDDRTRVAVEWLVRLWVSFLAQPSDQVVLGNESRRQFYRLLPALVIGRVD